MSSQKKDYLTLSALFVHCLTYFSKNFYCCHVVGRAMYGWEWDEQIMRESEKIIQIIAIVWVVVVGSRSFEMLISVSNNFLIIKSRRCCKCFFFCLPPRQWEKSIISLPLLELNSLFFHHHLQKDEEKEKRAETEKLAHSLVSWLFVGWIFFILALFPAGNANDENLSRYTNEFLNYLDARDSGGLT